MATPKPMTMRGIKAKALFFDRRASPVKPPMANKSLSLGLWTITFTEKSSASAKNNVTSMSLLITLLMKRKPGAKALIAMAPKAIAFWMGNSRRPSI